MAIDKCNDEAEKQILGIIKKEREQAFWRRIKNAMASQTGGSVQAVQVKDKDDKL